jgi:hypothetical protein
MPKPSEIILELHGALSVTIEQLEQINRAENALAMLDATVQECEQTSARLQNVRVGLAEAEAALQSKLHIINDAAAERLRDINEQIAARQAELSSIQR